MAGVVKLQCAHRNHVERDCRDENLFDACQRCHLRYDRVIHADGARKTRNKVTGQLDALDEAAFQETLQYLIADMDGNPMRVVMVDAPEQRHSCHKVRRVESRPPPWYLNLCAQWGYATTSPRMRQCKFRRQHFITAINQFAAGLHPKGAYADAVLQCVKAAQRDPEEFWGHDR